MNVSLLTSIRIQGYRPFRGFCATLGSLEVLVGANGAGKSSLFEFLKFIRDSVHQDIPPEIVTGSIGQQVFHVPGPERFWWNLEVDSQAPAPLSYEGELMGPVGRIHVSRERVRSIGSRNDRAGQPFLYMDVSEKKGVVRDLDSRNVLEQEIELKRSNQLALGSITNLAFHALYNLREYFLSWRFYGSFDIAHHKIRKSVPIEQEPVLNEDAGNLSSVLHFLMTEHRSCFDELTQHLASVVPGFRELTVKARGGPGEVIAFWREEGVDRDLSLADLSDGILRLICWMCLCLQPNPPTLICIDEPDQGVHPRTLPILSGLFEKASERTQILLATHASYFLTQFDISHIAVMRKENGEAVLIKPKDSSVLASNLDDFGSEEIEAMHRTDELEQLA